MTDRTGNITDLLLEGEEGFATQMAIWRYAVLGDLLETSVLIAEGHPELVPVGAWDKTAAALSAQAVSHGDEPYRRVKDWAACPWIGAHMLRGHAEWIGL